MTGLYSYRSLVRFDRAEIAEMLRRGACMCGIEDAQRNPNNEKLTVPTSANCEVHRG